MIIRRALQFTGTTSEYGRIHPTAGNTCRRSMAHLVRAHYSRGTVDKKRSNIQMPGRCKEDARGDEMETKKGDKKGRQERDTKEDKMADRREAEGKETRREKGDKWVTTGK